MSRPLQTVILVGRWRLDVAIEIERKFLVDLKLFKDALKSEEPSWVEVRQGFLNLGPNKFGAMTRIRKTLDGAGKGQAFLTVKAASESTLVRQEFEYEIPLKDAGELLKLCEISIEKKRFYLKRQGKTWEVDVFSGSNKGLVVAEIELESKEESFIEPDWVMQEVTDDPRYLNSNLAVAPFVEWG